MKPSTSQPSVKRTGPATAPSASQGRSTGLRTAAMTGSFLLGQAHLEANSLGCDLARTERAGGGEALERAGRVGAALEHLESRLGGEGAEPAELHPGHFALDVGMSRIAAHVLDHGRPAGAQDPVYLGQHAARIDEVLESR